MPDVSQTAAASFLDKLVSFQAPSQTECVNYLSTSPLILSIPLAAMGIVFLVFGWRLHKPLVTVNAVAAGAMIGGMMGNMTHSQNPNVLIFGSVAGSVLLGILAMLLVRGTVSLMGVLIGAGMGFGAWVYMGKLVGNPALEAYPWAGALVGLVALGLLAYANFRLAVMIFTAFQGAVMLVAGMISLLLLTEAAGEHIRQSAQANVHFLAALVAVPTVVGFAVQHVRGEKGKAKPKPA